MIIVGGVPRSGTSATMDIMSKILGLDRIVYKDREAEAKKAELEIAKRREEAFDGTHIGLSRKYAYDYIEKDEKHRIKRLKHNDRKEERKAKSEIMNPKGFYEDGRWCVRGINWKHRFKDELNGFLEEKTESCIKIVSQGFLSSDPRFFTKIIYLMRNPREVAKSQENLQPEMENPIKDGEEQKKHSPRHYISATVGAAKFLLENPDIPLLLVKHKELMTNPEEVVNAISSFVGVPIKASWDKAKDVIDASLYRSKPDPDATSDLWEIADKISVLFAEKKFQEILDIVDTDEAKEVFSRGIQQFFCTRLGSQVTPDICKNCLTDESTRKNFRKTAEKNRIKWKKEPCLFETGFDTERNEDEYISIKDSIKFNHWQEFANFKRD